MLRVILWILLAWFIYKFVFDFLIPLVRVGVKVRRQVKDFQQQFNNAPQQTTNNTNQSSPAADNAASQSPKAGEYIDFEEIK
jgi:hypothetical protein